MLNTTRLCHRTNGKYKRKDTTLKARTTVYISKQSSSCWSIVVILDVSNILTVLFQQLTLFLERFSLDSQFLIFPCSLVPGSHSWIALSFHIWSNSLGFSDLWVSYNFQSDDPASCTLHTFYCNDLGDVDYTGCSKVTFQYTFSLCAVLQRRLYSFLVLWVIVEQHCNLDCCSTPSVARIIVKASEHINLV